MLPTSHMGKNLHAVKTNRDYREELIGSFRLLTTIEMELVYLNFG